MLMRVIGMVLVSIWISALGNAAGADVPDWKAAPRYETVNLSANFSPDPYQIDIEAGGTGNAEHLGPDCAGYIDFSKPDVDLNYDAGEFALAIHAVSPEDLTLVILDPDGDWFCNDDFRNSNPGIEFFNPKSGNYNIWVGTYTGVLVEAALVFSEASQDAPAVVSQGSVNFGDNQSSFARDGECDDDRFEGYGMANTFIDEDRFHDADDCLELFQRGDIRLKSAVNSDPQIGGDAINFGDNQSEFAYDRECDDDRFEGQGMASTFIDEDRFHDAADCRALFEQGDIRLRHSGSGTTSAAVDFGDNQSEFAYDRECDDDRFEGQGMASTFIDEDRFHDAADCRALFEQGDIRLRHSGSGTTSAAVDFGDNRSDYAYDRECDDDRFEGTGMAESFIDADRFHDAADCQALYDSGDIRLKGTGNGAATAAIDFGDNESRFAHDGTCDDDRFEGYGVAETLYAEDRYHDADDCKALYDRGNLTLNTASNDNGGEIDFGDNRSDYAFDRECDDDRFVGQGMAETFIDADRFHDAADCEALYQQGRIRLR